VDLDGAEIHLRHSASGLTARVVAESPEALAMLQQSAGDLQAKLEEAGLGFLTLDIGSREPGTQERGFAAAFAGTPDDRSRQGRGEGRGRGRTAADDVDAAPVQRIRTRLPLPGGALVDVIA
jgi:hypothetical protein